MFIIIIIIIVAFVQNVQNVQSAAGCNEHGDQWGKEERPLSQENIPQVLLPSCNASGAGAKHCLSSEPLKRHQTGPEDPNHFPRGPWVQACWSKTFGATRKLSNTSSHWDAWWGRRKSSRLTSLSRPCAGIIDYWCRFGPGIGRTWRTPRQPLHQLRTTLICHQQHHYTHTHTHTHIYIQVQKKSSSGHTITVRSITQRVASTPCGQLCLERERKSERARIGSGRGVTHLHQVCCYHFWPLLDLCERMCVLPFAPQNPIIPPKAS